MQKLNIPIKRWRKKYMILYQTEINNFCINDFFHEYNRKLHYRLTKEGNELLVHPVLLGLEHYFLLRSVHSCVRGSRTPTKFHKGISLMTAT